MKKTLLSLLVFFQLLGVSAQNDIPDEMVVFPNTASTQVNVLLADSIEPVDLAVYDTNGRLIKKVPLTESLQYRIDTSVLPKGLYLVVVTTAKSTIIRKFMVDPTQTDFEVGFGGFEPTRNKKSSLVASKGKNASFAPLDDAYLQGSTRYNTTTMRVYTTWRSSYFKFDLRSISGKITGAKLRFTIDSDAGSGEIRVYKGSSTNWTEENLSSSNKPGKSGSPIGKTSGTHGLGKRVSIDLDPSKLSSSLLSLVMVQAPDTNDFAFASKEHATKAAPELLITYENDNGSTGNNDNSGSDDFNLKPLDDAYLQGAVRYNTSTMRVHTNWRSSYLKFDLRSIPRNFTKATLQFTIDSDAGSGEIQVYKGSSTNWTEDNLSASNKPGKSGSPIGKTSGTHGLGKRVSIDLDVRKLSNSLLSLIMVQPQGTNDFAFASKEHTGKAAPSLLIEYGNGGNSGGGTDPDDDTDSGGNGDSSIIPLDDAYLQGTKRYNSTTMRVHTSWRSSYFKFDLRSLPGKITGAKLKFTVDSDPGSGEIQVYKGSSTNWTEENLSAANKPGKSGSAIGKTNGTHSIGKRVSIDLDASRLSKSLLSLVMVQPSGTDDFAFASKEHASKAAPELVLSFDGQSNNGDKDPENGGFDFEITFNSMQVLLAMQSAIAKAQRAAVDRWLREQENNFKDEINRQLGTDHGSFSAAQKDFFKEYEKNLLRVEEVASRVGSSHSRKSRTLDTEQERFTYEMVLIDEWKELRDACKPRGIIDCGQKANKVVRGTRLGSASIATLDRLRDGAVVDFSEKEYGSAEHKSWARGIANIINDNSLLNTMVNNHIGYYNQSNLEDKIFLMTGYLVNYNNRHLGVMQRPIPQYNPPQFWDNNTLLTMGKKEAPTPNIKALIFAPNYIEDSFEACQRSRPRGPKGNFIGPDNCTPRKKEHENLRDQVLMEHMDKLLNYEEFGMTVKLNRIRDGFVKFNGSGKIGGLNALEYSNYIPDGSGGNRFYSLKNGGWVYRSNSPRSVNDGIPISEPSLNDDGYYYYIYNEDTKGWHELLMPAKGISMTSDPYLVQVFWKGMKGVARYALPIEDLIIMIDGKDLDGNLADRAEAGVWLVIDFVPGGKIVKPVTKIVKGLKVVGKVVKVGGKSYSLGHRTVNGLIEFTGKSNFRKIVGAAAGDEAHHIVPWALRFDEVVQKAAEWGFHMNDKINGIPLRKFFQNAGGIHGPHPRYNEYVLRELNRWKNRNPNFTPEDASKYLEHELIPELLELIQAAKGSGLNLNEFFRLLL